MGAATDPWEDEEGTDDEVDAGGNCLGDMAIGGTSNSKKSGRNVLYSTRIHGDLIENETHVDA